MVSLILLNCDVSLVIILFLGYLALWYIKKKELLRATGIDADVIRRATRPIQGYFGFLERVMKVVIVVILLGHFFLPHNLLLTTRLFGEKIIWIKVLGFTLGLIGLFISRIAQITIGNSWRVGIDVNSTPGLITTGIYRFVRNPTYTGIYLLCVGALILLPTILVSYWILAFFIMMEFQVRSEEEYLEMQYGNEYIQYTKQTKRYIPWLY